MNPSPLYLAWLKGEDKGYDWVDLINYILIANAELTDYNLSNNEIEKIVEACDDMFAVWCGEGVPYTEIDVKKKLQKAINWYERTQDSVPEDEMDDAVLKQVRSNMKWLKEDLEWFNPLLARKIVSHLIDVAKADSINENEKGSINYIAEYFEVEKPFK